MALGKLDEYNVENSSYDNGASGLTAVDMQAALDEIVVLFNSYLLRTGDATLDVSFELDNTNNANRIDIPFATNIVTVEGGASAVDKATVTIQGSTINVAFDGGATEYIIRKGGATSNEDLINKAYLDGEIQYQVKSDVTGVTGADPINNIMSLTQAEYDAIGVPDSNTFYLITDAASNYEYIAVSCSDLVTSLTTGTSKGYFRVPFAATINDIRASVISTDPPTGANLIIDINDGGASIYSTRLVIDDGTSTSVGSATTPVRIDSTLLDDAIITIDIDQVGSTTPGKGLIVTFELIKN